MLTILSAGLPNIKGSLVDSLLLGRWDADGTFYVGQNYKTAGSAQSNIAFNGPIFFDASYSNTIYGASNTVQPPSLSSIAQLKF